MDMYTYPVDNNPGGGKDMGVYNLEDGSKEPLNYKGQSLSYTCPPAWSRFCKGPGLYWILVLHGRIDW
ncbi:hypothetical protein CsSME_00052555 [Camellia sinensis var. sinensis]